MDKKEKNIDNKAIKSEKTIGKKKISLKKVTFILLSVFMVLLLALFGYLLMIYNKLGDMEYEGEMIANPSQIIETPQITDDVEGLPVFEGTPSPTLLAEVTPTFTPGPTSAPAGITNILIIGCDTRKRRDFDVAMTTRNDVNLILTIDEVNNEIKLSSYMRDILVYYDFLNDGQGAYNRLNTSMGYYDHPDGVIKTMEENFTVDIHYYMLIDFWGVEDLINTLGGVRVYLTDKETHALNDVLAAYNREMGEATGDDRPIDQHFVPHGAGVQTLNGRQAVSFMRVRKIDSDFGRIDRQHDVLEALKKKIMNMDLVDVVKIIDILPDVLYTNMTKDEIVEYTQLLYSMKDLDLQHATVPFTGTWRYESYYNMSVVAVDFYKNNEQLIEFIYH